MSYKTCYKVSIHNITVLSLYILSGVNTYIMTLFDDFISLFSVSSHMTSSSRQSYPYTRLPQIQYIILAESPFPEVRNRAERNLVYSVDLYSNMSLIKHT